VPAQPSQIHFEYRQSFCQNAARVLGDDQYDQAAALAAARAEVGKLKKKLEQVELENRQLKAQLTTLRTLGGAESGPPASEEQPATIRPHAYDPAAIAANLRLPFASAAFLAAWVGYRTYREEMKLRRLSGGMMEQQQLDKLAQLAAGDEATALALIAQAIGKGWQDFYPLDKPRPTTSHATATHSAISKPGAAHTHVPTYGKL
jgi:hypothetical protein